MFHFRAVAAVFAALVTMSVVAPLPAAGRTNGAAPAQQGLSAAGAGAAGAAEPARLATLSLVDGSTMNGWFTCDVAARVAVVATRDGEGRRTIEYLRFELVASVVPDAATGAGNRSAPDSGPLKPPVSVAAVAANGAVVAGTWVPETPPGTIGVLPAGAAQPLTLPLPAFVRIRMSEAPASGQGPVAGDATGSALQPTAGGVNPALAGQLATVRLLDGTTLVGEIAYDPQTHALTVLSSTDEGQRTLDVLTAPLVKDVRPAEGAAASARPSGAGPLKPPVTAEVFATSGAHLKGTWHPEAPAGSIGIVPDGATQPTTMPLPAVARLRLVECSSFQGIAAEPNHGNPPAEPARDAGPGGAKAGNYYGIPIGPVPAIPADVPGPGTSVILATNLGQRFTGVVDSVDADWIGLYVSDIAGVKLDPPRLTLVNRKNIVSVRALAP